MTQTLTYEEARTEYLDLFTEKEAIKKKIDNIREDIADTDLESERVILRAKRKPLDKRVREIDDRMIVLNRIMKGYESTGKKNQNRERSIADPEVGHMFKNPAPQNEQQKKVVPGSRFPENYPGNLSGQPNLPAGRASRDSQIMDSQAATPGTHNSPEASAFPTLAANKIDLPPLVRRDRQALSQPESFYPSMAYDEDQHEPWSDEAVVEAVRLYPGLAERKSVANRLAGMTAAQVKLNIDPYRVPEEEEEEEKYRLPTNPTLRDALRHHASGKRKL